jgi:hypothetical protein
VTWDDFSPFILPHVPDCPDATVEHHALLAAIAFCRHTHAWQQPLAALTGDGSETSFQMVRPTDAEVAKIISVAVTEPGLAGTDAGLPPPISGAQHIMDGMLGLIAFTTNLRTLVVWPAQPAGTSIIATVSLKPSLTAATIPEDLFAHYAQDIAAGALATILAMPNKAWTDLPTAAVRAAEFNARKAAVARIVERGFAKSGRRNTTRWF